MSKRIILDAHWCSDGVWRCDVVPADHREPQSERPGHWEWLSPEEFEKLFHGDWDRSYSTYAEPNPHIDPDVIDQTVEELKRQEELRMRLFYGKGPIGPTPFHSSGT